MKRNLKSTKLYIVLVVAAWGLLGASAAAQTNSTSKLSDGSARQNRPNAVAESVASDDQYLKGIYQEFYNTYRLGPADEVAVRILGQPDYSLEKAQVSPDGRIYHPLLGEVQVAGLTISQLKERLAVDLSQYIIDPKVSVSLLTANSALIGVLGDVTRPGIVVMSKPMTILDALSYSGGVTDLGNKSSVTLLRRAGDRMITTKVNVKRILQGKAELEENPTLKAGDTIIVHGNVKKKIGYVTSVIGLSRFLDFLVFR